MKTWHKNIYKWHQMTRDYHLGHLGHFLCKHSGFPKIDGTGGFTEILSGPAWVFLPPKKADLNNYEFPAITLAWTSITTRAPILILATGFSHWRWHWEWTNSAKYGNMMPHVMLESWGWCSWPKISDSLPTFQQAVHFHVNFWALPCQIRT